MRTFFVFIICDRLPRVLIFSDSFLHLDTGNTLGAPLPGPACSSINNCNYAKRRCKQISFPLQFVLRRFIL